MGSGHLLERSWRGGLNLRPLGTYLITDGIIVDTSVEGFLKFRRHLFAERWVAPVGKIMERRVCFCVSTCSEESRATLFAASANIFTSRIF